MAPFDAPPTDAVVADLERLWTRFSLPTLDLKREPVSRFQSGELYPDWSSQAGIYMFADRGGIYYIGRALRTSLGARLKSQCNAFGDPRWDTVIKSQTAEVLAAPLPADLWYLAASLEAALIAAHRPPHSKRIS